MKESSILFQGQKFTVESIPILSSTGKKENYQVVTHPGAVVILPLLNHQEVILIQNERYAIGKTLWELPAGTMEKGEDPQTTATRELEEETGYVAKTLKRLFSFYSTPGFCNEMLQIFTATELTKKEQKLDATEKIDVHVIEFGKAIEMIHKGEIIDGKTIATLLYYQTFTKSLEVQG